MSFTHLRRNAGLAFAAAAAIIAPPCAAGAYANPAWTQPQAPFRIAGDVYYVGSKGLAAYLITSPQGHILLDGTVAENAPMIEANIRRLGFRLKDVKILLNSHAHHDHAGGLARLKADTGAQLWASPGDRWALEHGRPRGDNTAGDLAWPAAKVDRLLKDGEVIRLGSVAMTTVFTPGHTPGCTSWTMPVTYQGVAHEVLFLCSLTVAGNVLVGNKAYPGIVTDYRQSLKRLEPLNPADIVLTAHPEVTDVIGRHQAQLLGDPDPWSDSGQLVYILDAASDALDKALGKSHPPYVPVAAPADETTWRTLVRAKDHFAVRFPRMPMVIHGRYDLDGGTSVPARTWTAEQGKVVYRFTVADVTGRSLDREAVFRSAVDRLSHGGELSAYAEARIRLVHGRQISVEWPGGAHAVASVFITGDRIYELEAKAPAPGGRAATTDLIRFQQMLNLY